MIEQVLCSCGARTPLEIPDELDERFKQSLRRVGSACERCQAEAETKAQAKLAEERRRRAEARVGAAGIPAALRAIEFDRLDLDAGNDRAIEGAKRWASGAADGIVLTGGIGVGKTTIAAAAAWKYLQHGRRLRWTSAPHLFAMLGVGNRDANRRTATDLMTGGGALVLDDLDKARPTDYGAEIVFGVIDNRVALGAPLFITMNLTYEQLALRFPAPYGEAIASRLLGYCGAAFLVDGRDRRVPSPVVPLPGLGDPVVAGGSR